MIHQITHFAASAKPNATSNDHAAQTTPSGPPLALTLQDLARACQAAARVGSKGSAGYICPCAIVGSRSGDNAGPASLALIDADDGAPDWAALSEYEGFAWTTHSHVPGVHEAWRIAIPFVEPVAHGALPPPWPGAHIRNRSQPAFLPTHPTDVSQIEWKWLGGTKRLVGTEAKAIVRTGATDSMLAAAFEAAGWVIGERAGGVEVRCPWVSDHSDGQPGGSMVFFDDPDGAGQGKFFCSRTECMSAHRTSRDALEVLRAVPAAAAELRHWTPPATLGGLWTRCDEAPAAGPFEVAGLVPVTGAGVEKPDPFRVASAEAWIAWMNSKHTVLTGVGASGKVRVMCWTPSQLNPAWRVPQLQSPRDFMLRYQPLHARIEGMVDDEGRPVGVAVAPWWLGRSDRSEAGSLTFRPDLTPGPVQIDGTSQYNLWRGFGVTPRAGAWSKMQDLIETVMAAGDTTAKVYIYRWLAWTLQNPGARAEVVLVFRGGKGTGKNTLLDAVCHLFGQHGKMVSNPKHLTGSFNAHLQDCAFLFANEAIPPNDKPAESILKTLVTDPTIAIERKGIDVEHAPNCLSLAMASNEAWCVPAGLDERRFAVFDVSDDHKGDLAFFRQIHAEMRAGGYEAMLHDLLKFPLDDWHPRQDVPKTSGLLQQQLRSLRGVDRVMYDALLLGENPGRVVGEVAAVSAGAAFCGTVEAIARCTPGTSAQLVCDALETMGGERAQVQVKLFGASERKRGVWLPALAEARAAWCEAHGLAVKWPTDGSEGWR